MEPSCEGGGVFGVGFEIKKAPHGEAQGFFVELGTQDMSFLIYQRLVWRSFSLCCCRFLFSLSFCLYKKYIPREKIMTIEQQSTIAHKSELNCS
jgi:hypothetical protein